MIGHKLRTATAAATALLCACPAPAFGCNWFKNCFAPSATTTYYSPMTAVAPAPCCGQTQTVGFMPQTSFRTVVVNQPVTSFVPTTGCNACGMPTTVMRPVTSFVQQVQVVPTTVMRPVAVAAPTCCGATPVVAAMPVAPTSCCGQPQAFTAASVMAQPVNVGFAPAPTTSFAPAVSAPAAPACCGASASTLPLGSSARPVYASAPAGAPGATVQSLGTTQPLGTSTTFQPASSAAAPALSTQPPRALSAPPATSEPTLPTEAQPTNRTFDDQNQPAEKEPESRILLPPRGDVPSTNTGNRLRGLDSDMEDRTTAVPIRNTYAVRTASAITPIRPAAKLTVMKASAETPAPAKLNDGGWRESRP